MVVTGYRDLNALDLVKKWKELVNDQVHIARDSHLLKETLNYMTPVQILLGMYQYREERYTSIPRFLQEKDNWYEPDEAWAEVLLAVEVSNHTPPDYYVYLDNLGEETSLSFQKSFEARQKLRDWADRVIG